MQQLESTTVLRLTKIMRIELTVLIKGGTKSFHALFM